VNWKKSSTGSNIGADALSFWIFWALGAFLGGIFRTVVASHDLLRFYVDLFEFIYANSDRNHKYLFAYFYLYY
jgi:hypothetical protein